MTLNDLRFGLGLVRGILSMVTVDTLTRRVIDVVTRGLPQRDITGPDGSLYMRQYLLSNSKRKDSWRLRIHHFVRGDEDRELHNHPWYGLSLILSGGYREEYRAPNEDPLQLDVVRTRDVKPWRFNFITPRTSQVAPRRAGLARNHGRLPHTVAAGTPALHHARCTSYPP